MKQKTASRKIKILVAKLGLDGHDRGALVLCRGFRDAGMEVIYSAEQLFLELTGRYTLNGEELFKVVQQARDSLMGDSLFYGDKIIHIDGVARTLNIPIDLQTIVDTTFSSEIIMKKEVLDVIYTVGIKNEESGHIDTIFVNKNNTKD